ncbi:MAG: hypothetical protein DRQ10_00340 [Candidatus Hydrothermota bacterium]|nr:MAG: hypothetical protein DRQ10_00340 [Candidatus Hydrothermae bacterium]
MAVARVEKVAIFVHKSEKDKLLQELQKASLFHVSDVWQSPHFSEFTAGSERQVSSVGSELLQRLKSVINVLKNYAPSQKSGLFGQKEKVSLDEFHSVVKDFDPEPIISEFEKIQIRKNSINLDRKNLQEQLKSLEPWKDAKFDFSLVGKGEYVTVIAGTIPVGKMGVLEELPIEFQIVNSDNRKAYVILAFMNEDENEVKRKLGEAEFEQFDFRGDINEEIKRLTEKLKELDRESEELKARLFSLAQHLRELKIYYDFYSDLVARREVEMLSFSTEKAFVVEGWVKSDDKDKLEKILSEFESVSYSYMEPFENEKPPVALKNSRWSEPYELITEMYGLPDPREVDPTPLLAPFFALFFGVCLTDAAYGLVLTLLSLWAIRKFSAGDKLFKIIAMGGVCAIIAGMLTGGWFGDLFVRLNIPVFAAIRSKFMWFDPMEEPMKFFYISLVLGYVQILWGLLIGFYNKWKWGERLNGIANELAWVVFLIGLVVAFVFHISAGKLMIYASLAVILFLSGTSKNPVMRILQGLYNIYGGIGFLGDLLSYVRLMARGMVTAGIAMAVNITAQLVIGIPILGWILAFLIFIGGHIFSIAVNVLGAFVHTMRLQYVEFFTKFYQNGGRPFRPFGPRHEFVEVVEG